MAKRVRQSEQETPIHVVYASVGLHRQTGFWDWAVDWGLTHKQDHFPESHESQIFAVLPAPGGHYILEQFDYTNGPRSNQHYAVEPRIIDVYHRPFPAQRRICEEVGDYTLKLMERRGLDLETPVKTMGIIAARKLFERAAKELKPQKPQPDKKF